MQTNRLSKTMENALNSQVTQEAYAAQIYLMLACWADHEKFDGVKDFMIKHSAEERTHMAKIIEYIQERGGKAKIDAIKKPTPEPKNILECFEEVLKQEIENTEYIYNLVNLSLEEKDWATWNFLHWLVAEQREEEKLALELLDKVKLAGGAKMDDTGKFEINKLLSHTGQEFPTADKVNPFQK